MNERQNRTMIIHFNDGSKKRFEFPTPVADSDANLAARLKEALDARHLPAPRKLPAYAIQGVSFEVDPVTPLPKAGLALRAPV